MNIPTTITIIITNYCVHTVRHIEQMFKDVSRCNENWNGQMMRGVLKQRRAYPFRETFILVWCIEQQKKK